ncbi:ShlB/FhaC/HecB family hemolysin secretion/activation protein [Sphingomonas sp. HDW15A]|uniref:ShlB/FhaC/HecB family hemolysin secretion/activation protein n=1 Tax=Sphingomonas sp. HDW15A TaxID=2714942 RepID=UPI00140C95A0|nr:ShlB/FhaC/HecB family hemolysin secretion/activation protein [Sphingomonas sp. HDW15A]QIK97066.1 ShlB/FhaC/HecB family hemolysin secretion/activation protein [Sphingomonas sp. HDW15A]
MGRKNNQYVICAAMVGAVASGQAAAQSIAPTREELTRVRPQEPPRSNLNVVGDVERSPCPLADPQYADIRVTVSDVQFNNLKGASPEDLRHTWAEYSGTNQPVSIICEIRDRAATYLRDQGYLAAVQVPTQRIENGVVKLEVLFARVTAVRARGQTSGAEAKLAGYLSRLTEDEVFNRNRAERYLLLARDLPGYNVQLTLKPAGTGPGELVGEVSVVRQPFSVDLMVQNLAAQSSGRWGAQLRGQAYGLTGLGDATYASIYSTLDFKEQQILQFGHSFRPGNEGLTVNGHFTYAWTKPDIQQSNNDPDLDATTLFATLGLAYPVIRSQQRNLTLGGGFDWVDQKVDFFGPLARDHIRIAWLRADYDAVDLTSRRPAWRVAGTLELRQGLDVFGASDRCCEIGETPTSRADGKPTATLIRANGTAEFALGSKLAVAFSPRAQLAFDPLLSFEEFTGGNYTIGRGYDPAIISGDSGVGAALELRGPRIPFQRNRFAVQPYVFGDALWVWNKNFSGDPDHLKSAGGGVRATFEDKIALDAVLAVPLEKTGILNERGDVRGLITLTTRLLPWR